MARNIPCLFCKQRRRKCEKLEEANTCKRCREQNRKCIIPKHDSDDEQLHNNDMHLQSLYEQVKQLEKQLASLDLTLKSQQKLISGRGQNDEPCWELEMINGQLRLKSKISTLEELLLYGKAFFRYLSPFGNTFHNTSMAFDRIYPSFLQTAIQLLTKYGIGHEVNSLQQQQQTQAYKSILTSSSVVKNGRFSGNNSLRFVQPHLVMDQLVNNYFACFNDSIPILHEPSFRKHYVSLKDPMDDPVVLAVCAAASISTCRHSIFYNMFERRYIGEHFFKLALEKLLEMFDEPEHALETVLVINILQIFMVATLRLNESRKWASIASVLCCNLQQEYVHDINDNENKEAKYLARVRSAIIHRNSVLVHCCKALIEFLLGENLNPVPKRICPFDILPDEPQKLKDLIVIMNLLFKLAFNPAFLIVMVQARNISAGDTATLTFEDIIRYEDLVLDWWHSLPEEFKICKEPYNLTKDIIQQTIDYRKILPAVYVYGVTMSIQACLIQPKPAKNLEHVHSIIRERAINMVMHAAEMTLQLSKQMEALGVYCYSPEKIIVRSIDCLVNLANIPNESLSRKAKLKLREHMHALSRVVPAEHQVSPDVSPYSLLTITPPDSAPDVFELYKNYPLPAEALMFDVVRTTVAKNINESNAAN
ncbi:hypothetical protein BDF20DRAFT_953575 [Mycotypha africana]|uniref:uncharacterized protein n=1 Tax=Mycotypha africana TaxID=64632 RepID=UPI002300AA58|nr:uncharacterized protein BDF20DRAFT_953575 [Mycotypha africana]KAI8988511.1 hypothetical protein BDF20DRAFT_953575 [Mycotypha africana]